MTFLVQFGINKYLLIFSKTTKEMIRGLGLTVTELMLARMTAIRYAGKKDKPARLVEMMLRFGVDFLTMTPLEAEQTKGLRLASSSHWDLVIASAPDHGEDSSSDESELSVGWDAEEELDPLPSRGTPEYTETVTRHIENLLQCYVSVQTTTQVGSLLWLRTNQSVITRA